MEHKDLVFNGTYTPKTPNQQAQLLFSVYDNVDAVISDMQRFVKYHRNVELDYVDDYDYGFRFVLYGNPLSEHDFNNLLDMECTCKDFHWGETQCPYALKFADNPDEVEYCMCCEFCAGNCANSI